MCKVIEEVRMEGIQEGMEIGEKKGMKKGMKKNARTTALRMLAAGKYALDEIADISSLPLNEVKKLLEKQDA